MSKTQNLPGALRTPGHPSTCTDIPDPEARFICPIFARFLPDFCPIFARFLPDFCPTIPVSLVSGFLHESLRNPYGILGSGLGNRPWQPRSWTSKIHLPDFARFCPIFARLPKIHLPDFARFCPTFARFLPDFCPCRCLPARRQAARHSAPPCARRGAGHRHAADPGGRTAASCTVTCL